MAAYNPPWTITASSQTAESFRRMLHYLLGGRGGVVTSGSLAVSQHAGTPNMSVDVAEGAALILGTEAAYQGAYFAEAQGVTTLSVSAAHATLGRLDLVVAKVQDAQYSGATNTWSLAVVTGTAAATPRYPAVPANAVVLAVVSVGAAVTQILNAAITDIRTGSASDGLTTLSNKGLVSSVGGVVVCTSSNRPTGVTGLEIYEADTAKKWRWNGSAWKAAGNDGDGAWQSFTPTTSGIGSPTLDCAYTVLVDTVCARYNVTLAGAASGTILLGLPVTAHSSVLNTHGHAPVVGYDSSFNGYSSSHAKIEAGGTTVSFWSTTSTGGPAGALWGATVPFTWAASDTINFTITYRRA